MFSTRADQKRVGLLVIPLCIVIALTVFNGPWLELPRRWFKERARRNDEGKTAKKAAEGHCALARGNQPGCDSDTLRSLGLFWEPPDCSIPASCLGLDSTTKYVSPRE